MKLLSTLAFFSACLTSASAFTSPIRFGAVRRSSPLNMVADDAKVVLVTGSSRGLGKAIALEMGKSGQKVVVNYVSDGSKESAEATCEEIKSLGGDAIAIQADSTFYEPTIGIFRSPKYPSFFTWLSPSTASSSIRQLPSRIRLPTCSRRPWKNLARWTS